MWRYDDSAGDPGVRRAIESDLKSCMKIYHVHHILVDQKYEAEDLLRQLREGKSFFDLAQKFSKCSSAQKGGDLGPIKEGKADPDFEEAALILRPGETSLTPIRTRFGYHLIFRVK